MTQKAYPLDDTNYLAEDVRLYHVARNVGVINLTGADLAVSPGGGMSVKVSPGFAYLHTKEGNPGGITFSSDAEETFQISAAGSTTRFDYISVRYTAQALAGQAGNTCAIVYTKGSSTRPTPIRNATTYEIILAIIQVSANTSAISAESIQDARADDEICGYSFDDFKYKVGTLTNRDEILAATPDGWFYFQLED